MAKRKVNKSQVVRDYMDKNPGDGPSAVSEALSKQGVKVTPQQVSTIKANAKKDKPAGKKKATRGRKPMAAAATGAVSVNDLVSAKQFASRVGGVDQAKQLIAALEKLSD